MTVTVERRLQAYRRFRLIRCGGATRTAEIRLRRPRLVHARLTPDQRCTSA